MSMSMPPILAYLVFSLATVIELLICWIAILWLAKQSPARLGMDNSTRRKN